MRGPHEPHQQVLAPRGRDARDKTFNGVSVSADELYRLHGEALRLTATPADAVTSLFPGAYRAIFHGRGLEFDEVRAYQWGDDYRTIDWRVTARTGQMHTKMFHQERERSLYLVVDASAAMHFGTRVQFKWVLAARIAALFGWLAVENGDRVGALLFGNSSRCHFLAPGMGEVSLLKIFKLFTTINTPPQADACKLLEGLKYLRQNIRNDALILLLSDFGSIDHETEKQLGYLIHHHDLAAIQLYDPFEVELPARGVYPVSDGQNYSRLDSNKKSVRRIYRQHFRAQQQRLVKLFRGHGVTLFNLGTHEPLVEGLRLALRDRPVKSVSHQGKRTDGAIR